MKASKIIKVDDLVIGSSPLMLIIAKLIAQEEQKVLLVERDSNLGGAWQSTITGEEFEVEIACHLIEFFPSVYELLESVSGIKFENLDLQPIRVLPSGRKFNYFGRLMLIASGIRLFVGWISSEFSVQFLKQANRNKLLNFREKFKSYLAYQLPTIFNMSSMKGPNVGYVKFLNQMVKVTKCAGAEIREDEILALQYVNSKWLAQSKSGAKIEAVRVHSTTAANLVSVGNHSFEAKPVNVNQRLAVVVDIHVDIVLKRQSYVAFWDDPDVTRISRIDSMLMANTDELRYLIELKYEIDANQLKNVLQRKLEIAEILPRDGNFSLIGKVNCDYVNNTELLPSGKISENFFGYNSTGNLAAGIISWMKNPPYKLLIHREKNGGAK